MQLQKNKVTQKHLFVAQQEEYGTNTVAAGPLIIAMAPHRKPNSTGMIHLYPPSL